jgi:DTW domain-containing protein YfiP
MLRNQFHLKLPDSYYGAFLIRKGPTDFAALCTAEAVAIALDVCEGSTAMSGVRTAAVRKVLKAWSDQQLRFVASSTTARHRTDKKGYVPGMYQVDH